MPRACEWFYPETTSVGRALHSQDGTWEVHNDHGVPLRPLPAMEANAAPSCRTRLREGQVEQSVAVEEGIQVMNFESYAAFCALSPERQAEVARRVREEAESNAAQQAEEEAPDVAQELEQQEKGKAKEDLRATAAKLKEHRRPQQGERVEYQVLRILSKDFKMSYLHIHE